MTTKILIHKLNVRRKRFSLKRNQILFEYLVENGTIVYIQHLETQDEFWEVIRTFQNVILSGNDLFIPTPPSISLNNQSKRTRINVR